MGWFNMVISKILDLFSSFFKTNSGAESITTTTNISIPLPENNGKIENKNEFNLTTIPDRNINAPTGSKFISDNLNLRGSARESNVLKEFLSGNIPDFLRTLIPVTVTNQSNSITYYVMPDYLSIGTDDDYCRMPMLAKTGKKIADLYGCILPTKKMVDDIYKNATIKLNAKPYGPPYDGNSMSGTARFDWSNQTIQKQLVGKENGSLVAGHKKDIVVTKSLLSNKNNIAIYGWYLNGIPIQGPQPNASSHDLLWIDYSQCIRLISQKVIVNGEEKNIYDVLNDINLCKLISDVGNFNARNIYK